MSDYHPVPSAVNLTLTAYNAALVQTAVAVHQRTGPTRLQDGPARNGNPPPHRVIPGPANSVAGTRINTGDPQGVSVTAGPRGGRPRRYRTVAEGNRARQRAYRARRQLVSV